MNYYRTTFELGKYLFHLTVAAENEKQADNILMESKLKNRYPNKFKKLDIACEETESKIIGELIERI